MADIGLRYHVLVSKDEYTMPFTGVVFESKAAKDGVSAWTLEAESVDLRKVKEIKETWFYDPNIIRVLPSHASELGVWTQEHNLSDSYCSV